MSNRVDSYNADDATNGVSIHSRLGHTSRVHLVAASTQFDLTGSDAGNSAFIQTAAEANTTLTFSAGSTIAGNKLQANVEYAYTLSKIVTHSGTEVVVLWK